MVNQPIKGEFRHSDAGEGKLDEVQTKNQNGVRKLTETSLIVGRFMVPGALIRVLMHISLVKKNG